MVKKSDVIFVASYAVSFILLGIWLLVFALGYVSVVEAFVLWLASIGLVLVLVGLVRTRLYPRGNAAAMGFGALLFTMGLMTYFVMGEELDLAVGIAIAFIVVGALILLIYLSRNKLEIEE